MKAEAVSESEKRPGSRRGAPIAPPALSTGPDAFMAGLDAHHDRVGAMARQLARRMGLDAVQAQRIGMAAAHHDVGKLFLDRAIFEVPRALTATEMAQVRTHATLGHAALGRSAGMDMDLAATVALQHHEQWDGGGYPFGLRGTEIGMPARIVAICDVYDALREARGYKPSYDHARAMGVLTRGDARTSATMFDPAVVAAVISDGGRFLDRVVREAEVRAPAEAPDPQPSKFRNLRRSPHRRAPA